ncbi:unnamed protein product [Linum tenue]|uniref:Uncharacterized protein n=2 Tax=Linum tenue TaxID=586396 RepID=A0AAV0K507_9ROSI|nr:unnamed protein product [Linum tenue]
MSILHSFGERLVLYLRAAPCHAKILQNCQPKPDPISRIHRPIVFSFFIACLVSLSLSLDLGNQRSESSIPWGLCLATCLLLTHITSANFGHPILRLHPFLKELLGRRKLWLIENVLLFVLLLSPWYLCIGGMSYY